MAAGVARFFPPEGGAMTLSKGKKVPGRKATKKELLVASERKLSVSALAAHKLYDNYKGFDEDQTDVMLHPLTHRTLRATLQHDIERQRKGEAVEFNQKYHRDMRVIFAAQSKDKVLLNSSAPASAAVAKPAAGSGAGAAASSAKTEDLVSPKLMKASAKSKARSPPSNGNSG